MVILALVLMKTHSVPSEQPRRIVQEMTAGISFVYSHKVVLGVIIMEATTSIFGLDNAMLLFSRATSYAWAPTVSDCCNPRAASAQ